MLKKKKKKKDQAKKEYYVTSAERAVELLSLPKEVVLGMPVVNLEGKTGLHIVNYKGIIEFSEEQLVVNTTIGLIRIDGKGLLIKSITSEEMVIKGRIGGVTFK